MCFVYVRFDMSNHMCCSYVVFICANTCAILKFCQHSLSIFRFPFAKHDKIKSVCYSEGPLREVWGWVWLGLVLGLVGSGSGWVPEYLAS